MGCDLAKLRLGEPPSLTRGMTWPSYTREDYPALADDQLLAEWALSEDGTPIPEIEVDLGTLGQPHMYCSRHAVTYVLGRGLCIRCHNE